MGTLKHISSASIDADGISIGHGFDHADIMVKFPQHVYDHYREPMRETIEAAVAENGGKSHGQFGAVFASEEAAQKFVDAIRPGIQRINRHDDEYRRECEEQEAERNRQLAAAEDAWIARYPHGKRVYFSAWGRGEFDAPAYAIRNDFFESDTEAVARAICRKNNTVMGTRIRSEGTSLSHGKPSANHYAFTMGHACDGGGVSPTAEVWFSLSIDD